MSLLLLMCFCLIFISFTHLTLTLQGLDEVELPFATVLGRDAVPTAVMEFMDELRLF